MLARAHTFTIEGLQTRHVIVEVDIRPGLPGFTIVGLANAAVARERQAARLADEGGVTVNPHMDVSMLARYAPGSRDQCEGTAHRPVQHDRDRPTSVYVRRFLRSMCDRRHICTLRV